MRKKKKDKPVTREKHVYSDTDIMYTEGFALDKYELADTIRKKERKCKRQAKGNVYSRIMELIEEKEIFDFFRLSNMIRLDYPELEEGFYDRASTFKAHIDSRRFAKTYGLGELSYTDIKKTLDKTVKRNEFLEAELEREQKTVSELRSSDKSYIKVLRAETNRLNELVSKREERIQMLESEVEYLKKQLSDTQSLLGFEKIF